MDPSTTRPRSVGLPGLLGCSGIVLAVAAVLGLPPPVAGGDDSVPSLGRWERVRVKMEARGELFAPTGKDGGEVRRPFNAAARLDFLEALPAAETAESGPAAGGHTLPQQASAPHDARGIRHFFSAASELSIDRGGDNRRSLEPATSTLIVSSSPAVTHFASDAFLTREETELLAIAFDPLLLNGLLPPAGATPAEWRPSAELTAALLVIDTVGRPVDDTKAAPIDDTGSAGVVAATAGGSPDSGPLLVRVEPAADADGAAKLLVTGTVHGAVDGVPTTIRVDGTYELDDSGKRVKSGIVRLREKRLAGHVSPGFACDATFQMARRPADGSQAVPAADEAVYTGMKQAWGRLFAGSCNGTPRTLRLQDANRRLTVFHDARWRAVADDARGLVLRMVDEGALLAECTVSPLPPGEAGVPLEEFRRDIERSLAGQLARFTASDEIPAAKEGRRVLRVVSEGEVDGVPLEWRHFLVEDGDGSRTAATFAVERRFADRFGRADVDFIAGLTPKKGPAP